MLSLGTGINPCTIVYRCILFTHVHIPAAMSSKSASLRSKLELLRVELPVLVVAGPSGSGKSTLLRRLFEQYPNKFAFGVSR